MTTVVRSLIVGCGHALPRRALSNDALAERVETSDEWIKQRTGIAQRYVAGDDETTAVLATQAARQALAQANLTVDAVDAIIVATTTPERTFPATAALVQGALGIERGFALDVQAVCSGFVYALALADNFIRLGQARCALVIGAENSSNSKRLVEVGRAAGCGYAQLVMRAAEIDWRALDGIRSIGVTAGASAPEVLINEVIDAFHARYDVTVEVVETAVERVEFKVPRVLRETA